MSITVTSRELQSLPVEGRVQRVLRAYGDARKQQFNGELKDIEAEIKSFEKKYHLNSEEMKLRLEQGTLDEDEGVCDWLIALYRLDRTRNAMLLAR
jgi:hypothetical protein